jgi:hypothetical protein
MILKKNFQNQEKEIYINSMIIVSHVKTLKIPKKRQIVRRMSIYYEII